MDKATHPLQPTTAIPEVERRPVHQSPDRLPHAIGPWRPMVAPTCIDCGLCVEVCPTDVFFYQPGRRHLAVPRAGRCLGAGECGAYVTICPADAIAIEPNPAWACLGDAQWTNAIIAAIWDAADRGPLSRAEPTGGACACDFDRLSFAVPDDRQALIPDETNLRIPLHHRGRRLWVELPVIGAMQPSRTLSEGAMLARARAARAVGTFTTVADDAYPPSLKPYADSIILRITGRFAGVTEVLVAGASAVALRHTWAGSDTPGHSVHALDDLHKQLEWLRLLNPSALLIVEIEAGASAPWAAAGAAHAGAHVIHLGGAGPAGYAINPVHRHLHAEGLRDQVALIAGGEVRTPLDALKAVALGADGVAIDAAEHVALGCVRCDQCETGVGCPWGIYVTGPADPGLIDPAWGARRIVNLYLAWAAHWRRTLALLSLADVRALRGRTDLLVRVGA